MTVPSSRDVSLAHWTAWGEATPEQRAHFDTLPQHRAWTRLCSGCGEGDFLERKRRPSDSDVCLQGRGFPSLPMPTDEASVKARPRRFRTPSARMHACKGAIVAGAAPRR